MFQLHKHELAVHRDGLEFVAVGHHDIGMELHAAFREAAEDADDVVTLKQGHVSSVPDDIRFCYSYRRAATSVAIRSSSMIGARSGPTWQRIASIKLSSTMSRSRSATRE